MAAASTIAAVVVAAAAVAQTAYTMTRKGPKLPKLLEPPVPSGPATQPDLTNFKGQRGIDPLPTPSGVSFGSGVSDVQKRSQLATQGVAGDSGIYRTPEVKSFYKDFAGDSGIYRTPEVKSFYKDLAIRSLTDQGGNAIADPLPIERQFARDVFGAEPRTGSSSSFLSALLRS
jgi:hypothetical protein